MNFWVFLALTIAAVMFACGALGFERPASFVICGLCVLVFLCAKEVVVLSSETIKSGEN